MEKKNLDWSNIGFGYMVTDKRYVADYKDGEWGKGELTSDANIVLNECAGILQYCQECFEGLKAYRRGDGSIQLFRPEMNARRMINSNKRLCMPEFPEVTEIANGNNLLRVRPMPEEYIKMAETYLLPIGYMGNNLLRSNWDGDHLEELDYNGLYEYLYVLKNQEAMAEEAYAGGIPKEEFENLITEYLPVSAKDLAGYAVFDAEKQTYGWEHLGPVTYAANRFSSSIPEVREIKENPDGTLEVSIDAVCQAMGEDCVISHILTMQILEDGGVRYLGNRVLGDGLKQITEYQYRLPKDQR